MDEKINYHQIVCFICGGELSTTSYCIPKPCTVHIPMEVCEKCFKEYLAQIGHHDGDAYPEGVSATPPTPLTYEFDSSFDKFTVKDTLPKGRFNRFSGGPGSLTMTQAVKEGMQKTFVPEFKLPEPDGRYKFEIEHHGEWDAGIRPYSDTVVIQVVSGDPGGDEGEFEEHMRQALKDWYDGATVETQKEFDLRIKAEDELYRGRGD